MMGVVDGMMYFTLKREVAMCLLRANSDFTRFDSQILFNKI